MSNCCVTSLPSMFTFYAANGQYLRWTLKDSETGAAINNSAITATLYAGRDINDPMVTPGTPVTNFNNISLPYVAGTYGQYQGLIPASFDPEPGDGYVLVVDAVTPGYQNQHWETRSQVVPGQVVILDQGPVTADRFRVDFPAFADKSIYSDWSVNFWLRVATRNVNADRWGEDYCLGIELYTAHNLVVQTQALQAALAGGLPGLAKGPISGEGAGVVHLSYDTTVASEENAGFWNLTEYGIQYIHMARMAGAGPQQIGGCEYGLAGIVPGGMNQVGWSGPNTKPGQSSFGS